MLSLTFFLVLIFQTGLVLFVCPSYMRKFDLYSLSFGVRRWLRL